MVQRAPLAGAWPCNSALSIRAASAISAATGPSDATLSRPGRPNTVSANCSRVPAASNTGAETAASPPSPSIAIVANPCARTV